MAKNNKKLPNPQQGTLGFDLLSMNNTREIANAVSNSIKKSGQSRYQIVALMSELVGREITKTMLDHYSGESHDRHVIPSDLVRAFCYVTKSNELKKALLEDSECLATGKDADYLKLAKLNIKMNRLEKQKSELEESLK